MTQRINSTTESGTSDPWTPAADFTIQGMVQPNVNASIELQTQLDATAPWVSVTSFRPFSQPLLRCVKLFSVRLAWSGNKGGGQISAWSVE